jgi:hypothetical protein
LSFSTATGLSGGRLQELRAACNYGYDPGAFDKNVRTLVSDKLIGKIDWNINDNHNYHF